MGQVKTKLVTSQAAGTINIAAAPGTGKHIEVVGCLLTLQSAGTLKFVSDAAGSPVELCGAMDVAAKTPVGNGGRFPVPLAGTSNKTCDLVTTTGVTAGVVWYSIEED